jgi:hypothetical protein
VSGFILNNFLEIPNGVDQYIDRVTRRCDSLIASQIWSGMDRNRMEYWLKSFRCSPETQYFSALVLDSLIYRSETQKKAMMIQAIQRLLPELLRSQLTFSKYESKWLDIVKKSGVSIRIVPVIRKVDGPNKSGNSICRDYGKLLGVNSRIIVSPDGIDKAKKDGCNLFVFVDDFLGTGNQFKKFHDEVKVDLVGATSVYLPLCAHLNGLNKVKEECEGLLIASPDILTDNDRLIKADDEYLPDGINKYSELRAMYNSILRQRLNEDIDEPEGYGGLGLVYGFHSGTPNATLPLLWSNKNKNLCLLLRS